MTQPSDFEVASLPKPRILVVDDREENLYAMRKLLRKLDAKIDTASSGQDALAMTLRNRYALILLDVQMPSMNGFEVAEFLRENDETAHIPIIFITAISKEEKYVFRGYEQGAVDYLYKPINPAILLSKCSVFIELANQNAQIKQTTLALRELNERYTRILKSIQDGVIGIDGEGKIIFINPSAIKLLKVKDEVIGRSVLDFLSGPNAQQKEWRNHGFYRACLNNEAVFDADGIMYTSSGQPFPAEIRFGPFSASYGPTGGVLTFTDISARKRLEELLKHQATFDSLTNIPNRSLFLNELSRALSKLKRRNTKLGVLFIDLDKFKPVNDQYGHAAGDSVLRAFSTRCKSVVRNEDLFARIGGDEFALLVEEIDSLERLENICQKILDCFSDAYDADGHLVQLSASIGGIIVGDGSLKPDEILDMADKCMYKAKKAEKMPKVYLEDVSQKQTQSPS